MRKTALAVAGMALASVLFGLPAPAQAAPSHSAVQTDDGFRFRHRGFFGRGFFPFASPFFGGFGFNRFGFGGFGGFGGFEICERDPWSGTLICQID